ncbi:hypothetical protein HELRODRAFT_189778 [Helobdella robusta]|uniref:Chromatin target of PRMT1 protein C-terminal domain-containing protein n=1 Tax=Helobdella robusta TaxID=6412 RepID=T1FRD3_HELRO|nr:hypothetical protein HELRODRAFT_189778 [Helobdella robusta]ESN91705.1 hypothetical protein HELRODRAFT_189778 [Helobdella robusta]
MAMPVPQKIVLKNSTSMSLNDRFTKINKVRPPVAQTVTVNMANQHQAAIKNRRLSQQMANRNQTYVNNDQLKPPIKSRLGIASRLGFKPGFEPRRGRQIIGSLLGQNDFPVYTPVRGRPMRGFFQGRGQTRGQRGFRGARLNTSFIPISNSTPYVRRPWGGSRGGRGRGRGGGVARGGANGVRANNKVEVTKDQLDTELDAYMSHTN